MKSAVHVPLLKELRVPGRVGAINISLPNGAMAGGLMPPAISLYHSIAPDALSNIFPYTTLSPS